MTENAFPKIGIDTKALVEHVEALIEEARKPEHQKALGAVNWGDLGVMDVEYRLSMLAPEQGPYCWVLLEEAAPDCGLADWVYRRLDKERFPRTHIECEW